MRRVAQQDIFLRSQRRLAPVKVERLRSVIGEPQALEELGGAGWANLIEEGGEPGPDASILRRELCTRTERALERLEASPTPHLVLMDCYMPVLDGFEATRRLRQRGDARTIVALTASAGPADRAATQRAGMDAHLCKPLDTGELERVLNRYLR